MSLQDYIATNFYLACAASCYGRRHNFFVREMGTRMVGAVSIPVLAAATTADIAIGSLLSVGSALTLRKIKTLDDSASGFLCSSCYFLPICGLLFLRIINPKADAQQHGCCGKFLCAFFADDKLMNQYDGFVNSQAFWKKHVASRIVAASSAPVLVLVQFNFDK